MTVHRIALGGKEGVFQLTFALDSDSLEKPGDMEYHGQLKFMSIPAIIPTFVFVIAELNRKPVASSRSVILPISLSTKSILGKFKYASGVEAASFYGSVELEKSGEYKVFAQVYPTPFAIGPPFAETKKLDFSVGFETAKPGVNVIMSVPITMIGGATGKCKTVLYVYEGHSLGDISLPGHGQLLDKQEKIVDLVSGVRTVIDFAHTTKKASNPRRDIEIEIYKGNEVIGSQGWGSIFGTE